MAKFTGHQSFLFVVGGVDIVFGMVLILLGADSVLIFPHGAVGVPMWAGIGLILIGLTNVVMVFSKDKKQEEGYPSVDYGSLLSNLVGTMLAALLIGFYCWGTSDVLMAGSSQTRYVPTATYTYEDLISLISTVLMMGGLVMILSLMVVFYALCAPLMQAPRPYGQPPRPHTEMYDGPYGLPSPSYMYKP